MIWKVRNFVPKRTLTQRAVVWRLCLGLGCVPGLISMYFRIMMHETSEFKKETKRQKRSYSRAFRCVALHSAAR